MKKMIPQIDVAALASFNNFVASSPQDQPIAWQFLPGGEVKAQNGTPTAQALDLARQIRPAN